MWVCVVAETDWNGTRVQQRLPSRSRNPELPTVNPAPATPPAAICLFVLGTFAVLDAGAPVLVPAGGQRVLAFLAVSRRPVPRSVVAGTLWPESEASQAAANLRAALTRLPRPQGCSLTVSSPSALELAGHVEVDLRRSEALIATGPEAAAPGCGPDDDVLGEDVLPEWEEDWLAVERERHRQRRLHALEARARSLNQEGRFGEALEAALAASAGEPLRETPHRLLMEIHLAEGNPCEAIRQYGIYRRLLAGELGLRPSPTLDDLVRPLVGHRRR
jgi:DNA-binding SARP family transcriptional activator